jgi:uncharacterized protein (DUF2235 family)
MRCMLQGLLQSLLCDGPRSFYTRAFFRENSFGEPHDAQQNVQEVWFAGVHSDVGGSYPEAESQLSKIAFEWMLCEAGLAGLAIDQSRKADLLGARPLCRPNPTGPQHESLHGPCWT